MECTIGRFYNIHVPEWRDATGAARGGTTREGKLVDILEGGIAPPSDAVLRYYGSAAPRGVFKAFKFDRLVFDLGEEHFIVVPDTPRNANTVWPRGEWDDQ